MTDSDAPRAPGRIVGLTGPNAAGKGEVAAYFAARGYPVYSLSDIIRERAAELGLPPEREHLIRIGNELRANEGAGALARRILARLGDRAVVDSIRNPAEVEVLRAVPHFVLVGVDAPVDLRFRRSLRRARPGDAETLEGFRAREAQENGTDPTAQQLRATFELADVVVDNGDDLEDLHARLDRLVDGWRVPSAR